MCEVTFKFHCPCTESILLESISVMYLLEVKIDIGLLKLLKVLYSP